MQPSAGEGPPPGIFGPLLDSPRAAGSVVGFTPVVYAHRGGGPARPGAGVARIGLERRPRAATRTRSANT